MSPAASISAEVPVYLPGMAASIGWVEVDSFWAGAPVAPVRWAVQKPVMRTSWQPVRKAPGADWSGE